MTKTERRRALMSGKKDSDVLFTWTPADGLSMLGEEGTSTTPLRIENGKLVVSSSGAWKIKYVTIPSHSYTKSQTIRIDYEDFPISSHTLELFIPAYCLGRSSLAVYEIATNRSKSWTIKANAVNVATVTPPPDMAASGYLQMYYDDTNNSLSFYINGSLLYTTSNLNPADLKRIIGIAGYQTQSLSVTRISITKGADV